MAHYAHILTVERLQLDAHLGFYDSERAKRQRVEISLRLYFPETPDCAVDDHAKFLDYGTLSDALTAWGEAGEFRLVEFMGMSAFRFLRAYLDERGHTGLRLWLKLHKVTTPLPNLAGGAHFIHSDLPPGSTTAFTPVL